MSDVSSGAAIVKAIVGNALVTLAKFVAWWASHSGAMLAEAIHSLVDTINQCLLLVGHRRSQRGPTRRHPYGFGIEASFWGLLAAVGILVFGGGVAIEHGLAAMADPHMPDHLAWALTVLLLSAIIEAWVLISVVRGMLRTRGELGWLEHLRRQSPGTITVVLEDTAAVLGCAFAGLALALCRLTGDGIYDAIAQLVIGVMLCAVGIYLIWRNRGVLIGMSAPREVVNEISVFLGDIDVIDRVTNLKTRQLTAYTFTLKAEVVFSGGEIARRWVAEYAPKVLAAGEVPIAAEILGRFAEHLMLDQARLVDHIEDKIRARFPGVVDIDLEPHLRDEAVASA